MFAIVDIAGQQFKVKENQKLYVPKLEAEKDAELTFDNVLLVNNDDDSTTIGAPYVDSIKVRAKVLEHLKDDKVIVFKKKRRISYRRFKGHRQQLTHIEVTKIA
jgi:large subunit ribosomal protein L21